MNPNPLKNHDWRHILAYLACALLVGGCFVITPMHNNAALILAIASPLFLYAGVSLPQGGVFASAAKKVGAVFLLLAFASSTSACISSAPVVPVTPANQPQVSSCQNTAGWHNGAVVGDFVFGGAGAILGGAGALVTDQGQKTGLAVGAAVAGGLTAIGTAIAGFTAKNFANSHCTEVVGDLPLGVKAPTATGGLK